MASIIEAVQAELEARESAKRNLLALTEGFPEQKKVILEKERMIAVRCSRRSAKSYSAGLKMVYTALEYPNCDILYVMHSRDQARNVMFRKILGEIDQKLNLGLDFNKQFLEVTFPNKSIIRMLGLDKDDQQANKVLGNKLKLVVIDEAAFYQQDLKYMVDEVFLPALADERGQLMMLSSANPQRTMGYFYDVTERPVTDPKHEPGFVLHRWKWHQNPFARDAVRESIEDMCKRVPGYKNTRTYRVQWEDEWIPDDQTLCYKYTPGFNDIAALPDDHVWLIMFGVDLGYEDPSSIVVAAWSFTHPVLYFLEVWKKKHADITTIASVLRQMSDKYKPAKIIIDAAAKQSVEELKRRHNLPLTPAQKHGMAGTSLRLKSDFIEMMNSDFSSGRIKLVMPACNTLADEYLKLSWDSDEIKLGNRVESSNRDNHSCDAALYVWRHCLAYTARPPPSLPKSPEEAMRREMREFAEKGLAKQGNKWWERDFGTNKKMFTGGF